MTVVLLLPGLFEMNAQSQSSRADAPAGSSAAVDVQPRLKKPVKVRFPRSVRRNGGEISLKFRVTREGQVSDITVIKFTDADMIEPAYTAYAGASYFPGMKKGEPVDAWVEVSEVAR
jgi:outer membrane biosynthesis protein TonB